MIITRNKKQNPHEGEKEGNSREEATPMIERCTKLTGGAWRLQENLYQSAAF